MTRIAFQDQIPDNRCFGCGTENPHGLQIKSYWDGDESVCTFVPQPVHMAGPPQYVNGGIIAMVIDCHSVCTAIADHYRRENRDIGSDPLIWCVTASMTVNYLRPVPIDAPAVLRARIIEAGPKKTRLSCTLSSGDDECAAAEVLSIRVPPEWRGA